MADTTTDTLVECNNQENNEEMEVVTMVDVLKEEQELEEDANAVLGGSDEKNCTYSKGYLKRQALYACMTCTPEAKTDPSKRAGVCLACSYFCHEGHEMIELYTKRNFRCDCGNSKFSGKKCNLDSEKSEVNEQNSYNHNFCGIYCTCERPYPDPEDKVVDEMIQCVICEDWYHCRHLGMPTPPPNAYSEMICSECIAKHEFLLNYCGLSVSTVQRSAENGAEFVKIEGPGDTGTSSCTLTSKGNSLVGNSATGNSPTANDSTLDNSVTDTSALSESAAEPATETSEAENSAAEIPTSGDVAPGSDAPSCRMPQASHSVIAAKFWRENWRQQLCTCKSCLSLYEKERVSYLTDAQDTVHFYEEKGKARAGESAAESQYEQGMKALSSLDRVKQVEAISEYNLMKGQLKEYLQKFADNKKVVREEDIREFFSTMAARKKQKVEVPYFCR